MARNPSPSLVGPPSLLPNVHRRSNFEYPPPPLGAALFFIFILYLRGAPLERFRFILVFFGRLRPNRRAAAAVSTNGPLTVQTSLRNNWFVVAVFGSPASSSSVDVEQGSTAPPPFDPSISTPSLAQPPPAYTRYHTDSPYVGDVAHNRPSGNTTFERDLVAVLTQYPPAYTPSLPSSSTGVAPVAVTAH